MRSKQIISCQQEKQMVRAESQRALVTPTELVGRSEAQSGFGNYHSCPGRPQSVEGKLIREMAVVD